MGINRFLNFILVTAVFAVTAIPFMVYMHFILRCSTCKKRGTCRLEETPSTKTEQDKDVLFYFVCQNCGSVKVINGSSG